MLLSAVSGLVVAQSSSEIPEGLMNNPVFCSHLILAPIAGDVNYIFLSSNILSITLYNGMKIEKSE
jgi:hypothetical protein